MSENIYERVIFEDTKKSTQIRLTVNEFRGIEYLHIRKYYLDFEEEWRAGNEGVGFPVDFENSKELFIALLEILSLAESKELLTKHFSELVSEIYIE